MKEHLFLLQTNLQPVEGANIAKADLLKQSFERLLQETVYYANGLVSEYSLQSNEFVTSYTLQAEEITARLTGVEINTEITRAEMELVGDSRRYEEWQKTVASDINNRSISLLQEVISFQSRLLERQLECNIFISLYPEMLEHDSREAIYYFTILKALQQKELPRKTLCEELNFWNSIMSEHAQFVDGMLDPTEKELKMTAETTAITFEKLVGKCIKVSEEHILKSSLKATDSIRNYKEAATAGLLECKIKSIIPPLLADHVLREANHYLKLLYILNK